MTFLITEFMFLSTRWYKDLSDSSYGEVKWYNMSMIWIKDIVHCTSPSLTLKEPVIGPISQPGGGFRPPKISETDWRNIKCVVLVDSYDPPESIGTKKSTNIPCMTPQWRHKWRHVKNTKITTNRQNHGFSLFFQAKLAVFGNDVCQSMLTHVLTPNKPNKSDKT